MLGRTWWSQSALMMKNSSTLTAPNGRMPPNVTVSAGCMYHGCGGIWRGIVLVRTGCVISSFLKPKCEPMKTSGVETPSQRTTSVRNVENGIAPLEPCDRNRPNEPNKRTNERTTRAEGDDHRSA